MKVLAWMGVVVTMLVACAQAGTEEGSGGAASGAGAGAAGGSATTATGTVTSGGGAASGSATTGTGTVTSGTTTTSATTSTGGTTTTSATTTSAATTSATTSTSAATTTSSTSGGATSGVTVYVTPDTGLVDQIVAAIEGATASVHMTMYILDDTDIVAALVARKKAGVDVRVVLNQTFPTGTTETNPATYTTLTAAGVGVVWRNGPPGATAGAYTHEKTFVVDGKQAWIMTMNLDHSSSLYNREYVAVDDNAADVAEADQIFLADYAGTANASGSPLVVSPDPPSNSRSAVVALIDAATKTVDVEVEEFGDNYSGGVTDAVAAAAKRGVTTRVILANATPSTSQASAVATVKAAGAKVVVSGGTSEGSTASDPYIHAKAITIDCTGTACAKGFMGSENFSAGSLGYNRELGLLLDDPSQLAKIEAAIDGDFSAGTPQ